MEISVGASETKSLDLKTVYKSEGGESKKRKNRREVAVVSRFEDVKLSKKIRPSLYDDDDVEVDAINAVNGDSVVGGDGQGVAILKRPRGLGGRSKLAKSFGFDLNDSVEKVVKLKEEVSLQDEVNEGSGRGDGFAAEVVKLNGEIGVEDEVGELKDGMKEVMQTKVSSTENDAPVSSGSVGCKDEVVKLNVKAKRNNGKNMKVDGLDRNQKAAVGSFHLAKGEGVDVVLDGKDSLSKRNGVKRKRVGSNVAKKVESLSVTELDPDDDLEQNAARMLSSRFDPSCTGFASNTTTLALLPLNEGSEEPMEAQDRVLRPRRNPKGKGTRKRRHFYEIHSADMDAHWFLNRKIKIFWPLDESWYYGLVNDYDAEKNLHHIKYDDRDEEWISLENERFKLLLLPSELPRKPSEGSTPVHTKDEAFMESEPIISWLAHHRIKSSSSPYFKKQKGDRSNNGSEEGHVPIVYVRRRRHHMFSSAADDATCVLKLDITQPSIPLISLTQCDKFEICIQLWPMLTYYVLGADILWLIRSVFLLRFGTMVTMWPSVFLEVLFVDNIVGLRLFLFEGCLKQAVAFVCLVMKVFCEPQKDESVNNQIPVTSIRFKLSFFQNFRNHKVFAYYSFSKVRDFDWRYLDSEFQPHCLLSKHLSLSECTYDNIKGLEAATQTTCIPYAAQTEVFHKKSNRGGASLLSSSRSSKPVPGPRTIYSLRHGNVPPFALSFTAAPNLFLGLHLKLLLERSISLAAAADADDEDDDDYSPFETSSESSSSRESHLAAINGRKRRSSTLVSDAKFNEFKDPPTTNLKGIISVEIPTSDEAYRAWNNLSDGIICSPNQNPTGPKRSSWHQQKSFGEADFFGNGPKKPRTQVQYTLPYSNKNKGHNNLPYQRIRKTNDKKISLDTPKGGGPRRNLELVACDANILINGGDKGWRECGARVFLEADQQKEWKLAVKCSGELRYAYKVHQDLQPGSTNRFTHAMMWKGGKDWALEFPDRSQWFVFKELHEECHNRNIRAASIKNIPIPGVRLINADDHQNHQKEECFTRTPWYLHQVRDDIEMAMDGSRVMYDMDSEDEEWVRKSRSVGDNDDDDDDVISDELFEKVMDMLEKVSYAQKRDHFTSGEVDELIARVTPMQAAKSIYEHWRDKRQRKGMALVRQLQPPLWEKYQQICREWEKVKPKPTTGPVSGSQEKASAVAAGDKPPMFAFCLKPRGLELLNRGSKHRPHKKISLSGHGLGDHDAHHSYGRRVHTYGYDERAESSDVSPMLVTKMYSPRDASMPGHFSLDGGDASDWNHQQLRIQSSKNIRTLVSPRQAFGSTTLRKSSVRRTTSKKFTDLPSPYRMHPSQQQQLMLGGSDLDEFRLRDASSAAKHARNMAKLKRERAQKLMLSADLAIHKAVSALMMAEAIKASCTGDDDDDESTRSTSPPSTS